MPHVVGRGEHLRRPHSLARLSSLHHLGGIKIRVRFRGVSTVMGGVGILRRGHRLPGALTVLATVVFRCWQKRICLRGVVDHGINDKFVRNVGQALKPKTSAILMLAAEEDYEETIACLKTFDAKIHEEDVDEETQRASVIHQA